MNPGKGTRRDDETNHDQRLPAGHPTPGEATLSGAGPTTDPDDDLAKHMVEIRKRNALYSKKKYYKKKQEVERLEGVKNELLVANERLRQENARLEAMYSDSQRQVHLLEGRDAEETNVGAHLATGLHSSQASPSESIPAEGLPMLAAAVGSSNSNDLANLFFNDNMEGFGPFLASGYPAISMAPFSEPLTRPSAAATTAPFSFVANSHELLQQSLQTYFQPLGSTLLNSSGGGSLYTGAPSLLFPPTNSVAMAHSMLGGNNLLETNNLLRLQEGQHILDLLAQGQTLQPMNPPIMSFVAPLAGPTASSSQLLLLLQQNQGIAGLLGSPSYSTIPSAQQQHLQQQRQIADDLAIEQILQQQHAAQENSLQQPFPNFLATLVQQQPPPSPTKAASSAESTAAGAVTEDDPLQRMSMEQQQGRQDH